MGNLLFSPSGRIGPAAYLKGIIILAVAGFLIGFTALLGPLAIAGSLLAIVLFYCFIALGIKRSHDAGKSGWMVLTHILLSFGVSAVVGIIVGMVTGVSAGGIFSAAMSQDLEALEAIEAATTSMSYLLIGGLAGAVGTVITGYLINMFNKSDAHDNQFGPATTGDS
jgi:uncharacterized membrane protein YhaH (DUF805 family)